MALGSHGTKFWIEDPDAPTLLKLVCGITDITGPGNTAETIDVSSHCSDGWREFIGGMRDGGEVTFSINFEPVNNNHKLLWDIVANYYGQPLGARIYLPYDAVTNPESAYLEFKVIPTQNGFNAPVSGAVTVDFTAKVSGAVNIYDDQNPSPSGLYT